MLQSSYLLVAPRLANTLYPLQSVDQLSGSSNGFPSTMPQEGFALGPPTYPPITACSVPSLTQTGFPFAICHP